MVKTRRNNLKLRLAEVLKNPDANLVENRYKVMHWVLKEYYPVLSDSVSPDTFRDFLREVVYLDRQVRLFTEGNQVDEKELLSQEFIVKELA